MSASFACFTAFYVVLIGCEAGGCSYFAAFVNNELRPYFAAHGMESESNEAYEAFVYLVISAVLLWLSFMGTLCRICKPSRRNSSDEREEFGSSCSGFLRTAASMAIGITIVVLACLTAKYAFGWWNYFASQGLDHLAANCHGLTGMVIAGMVLSAFTLVVMAIMIISSEN
ncbi:hypothetical protein F4776DRAFT_583441 [Hypoxylon sp. NC0597]|nr:hypothetical protein F4776DRAFT_583441 [Hypoxylon sp. NC0597]